MVLLLFPPARLQALLQYLDEETGPNGLFIKNRALAIATATARCNAVEPANAVTSSQVTRRLENLANRSMKSGNVKGIQKLFELGTDMLDLQRVPGALDDYKPPMPNMSPVRSQSNSSEGVPKASMEEPRGTKRKRHQRIDISDDEDQPDGHSKSGDAQQQRVKLNCPDVDPSLPRQGDTISSKSFHPQSANAEAELGEDQPQEKHEISSNVLNPVSTDTDNELNGDQTEQIHTSIGDDLNRLSAKSNAENMSEQSNRSSKSRSGVLGQLPANVNDELRQKNEEYNDNPFDIEPFALPPYNSPDSYATAIRNKMLEVGKECKRAIELRLRSAGLKAGGPVTVDFDGPGDKLSGLLATVLASRGDNMKERWAIVENMQAEAGLPLSIFLQSLLGAAITNWALRPPPQGEKTDSYAEKAIDLVGKLNPRLKLVIQKLARADQLDQDFVPKVPEKAREMALAFNRLILQFVVPQSDTDLSGRMLSGYDEARYMPDTERRPYGYKPPTLQNFGAAPPDSFTPNSPWNATWLKDLTRIFEHALKLRIEMEKMNGKFYYFFLPPNGWFRPLNEEGMPEGDRERCMLGLMPCIDGEFQDWTKPGKKKELGCAPHQAYVFKPKATGEPQ